MSREFKMRAEKVILQFSCPDKPGILAAVTQFLSKNDAFMTEVSSFSANDTNRFFNRIAFQKNDSKVFDLEDFESQCVRTLFEVGLCALMWLFQLVHIEKLACVRARHFILVA